MVCHSSPHTLVLSMALKIKSQILHDLATSPGIFHHVGGGKKNHFSLPITGSWVGTLKTRLTKDRLMREK